MNSGSRWWNWNTKPTCRLRNATTSASGSAVSSVPPIATRARVDAIEAAEHVQQRALPDARRADDRHHLARLDLQIEIAQHRQRRARRPA